MKLSRSESLKSLQRFGCRIQGLELKVYEFGRLDKEYGLGGSGLGVGV